MIIDNSGTLSNTLLSTAIGSTLDSEILYRVDANNVLTISGNNTILFIPSGHSMTPGNDVVASHVRIDGSFDAGNIIFSVFGNWTTTGTFTAGTSTVIFEGSQNTIGGMSTFYELIKSVDSVNINSKANSTRVKASKGREILQKVSGAAANSEEVLLFQPGSVTAVSYNLMLLGAVDAGITIGSISTGDAWYLNVLNSATYRADYLNIQDSNASGGRPITATNSVDLLRNVNWKILGAGQAVTSAVAEINPTALSVNSTVNRIRYSIFPTIEQDNGGVDILSIIFPASYSNISVIDVTVDDVSLDTQCGDQTAGEYCATITDNTVNINLGRELTSSTPIHVTMDIDAPTTASLDNILSSVTNSGTVAAPFATVAGDADSNVNNDNSYVLEIVGPANPDLSSITAEPQVVASDGVASSTLTTQLNGSNNLPVRGKSVILSSNRGAIDTIVQPSNATDANGMTIGSITSETYGTAFITANDITDGIIVRQQAEVYFNQGLVLELVKTVNRKEALVGDVLTYQIDIKNTVNREVFDVKIDDTLPPNFRYVPGSARLNAQPMLEPTGSRIKRFTVGTIPPLVDTNTNGEADAGESGYSTLSYQVIVSAGATPRSYVNQAVAVDLCNACYISNLARASIDVALDPLFDLGTVIGKVFEDHDRDGYQGNNEPGIAGAMVALDNGVYALTDLYGRYHFPSIKPGQRLIKINLDSVGPGSFATTYASKVVSVTPGLMAKVNFGVIQLTENETIGRAGKRGFKVNSRQTEKPIEIVGNVNNLTVIINGDMIPFETVDALIGSKNVMDAIELISNKANQPIELSLMIAHPEKVSTWNLSIADDQNRQIQILSGKDAPPMMITWDGKDENGNLVEGGKTYTHQTTVQYRDGTYAIGPNRSFGVNNISRIDVRLTGATFDTGKSELLPQAKAVLDVIVRQLKRYPSRKVVVEGHTDSIGSQDRNKNLSLRRAKTVEKYFASQGISPSRLVLDARGESTPIADNETKQGRLRNRRVEIKGEFQEITATKLRDQYRTDPKVYIDQKEVEIDKFGRFNYKLLPNPESTPSIAINDARGRFLEKPLNLPSLEVDLAGAPNIVVLESRVSGFRKVGEQSLMIDETVELEYTLMGQTDAGNRVELDGEAIAVDADGQFAVKVPAKVGRNVFSLAAENSDGYSRLLDIHLAINDSENGKPIMAIEPIPYLSVKLPPRDAFIKINQIPVSGVTLPDNRIRVNNKDVPVQQDGHFSIVLDVKAGVSEIVVQVQDPNGYTAEIKRKINVADTQLFFMAFVDSEVGILRGKGFLDGAGMNQAQETYANGRISYYLKGMIKGKYLITSAFDTRTQTFNNLFKDLDDSETELLLSNIDPEKAYPVYGDDAQLVNDAKGQGKFFLALDSDEIHLLMGNYPVNIGKGSLASYRRTLYGAHLQYDSADKTQYQQSVSKAEIFGAETRLAHQQDEILSTGGSLYYLSQKDITVNSEQITLVVRDKINGNVLKEITLQQGTDYEINYEHGRLFFHQPIDLYGLEDELVDVNATFGNPVTILVDYEYESSGIDKLAAGGRVRQQLGDHVAVGATAIHDQLSAERYRLQGVDAELRLLKGTRFTAEVSQSEGTGSVKNLSTDGGLTYATQAAQATVGKAWKLTAGVDLGEWVDAPNRLIANAFITRVDAGFQSSSENKGGARDNLQASLRYQLTARDLLKVKHQRSETQTLSAAQNSLQATSLLWQHKRINWRLSGELQSRNTQTNGIRTEQWLSALRLENDITRNISTLLEAQQALAGDENSQLTFGTKYKLFKYLTLKGTGTITQQDRSAQAGASYRINRNRFYISERVTEDGVGQQNTTTIGEETTIGENARVYSELQTERGDKGKRQVSLLGVEQKWMPSKRWSFRVLGNYSSASSAGADLNGVTAGIAVNYKDALRWNLSSRNEVRRQWGSQRLLQLLTSNNATLKLTPSYSLLAKWLYSRTENLDTQTVTAAFKEESLGLAIRPVHFDRFNALARYSVLSNKDPQNVNITAFGTEETVKHIAATDFSLDLSKRIEWVEKLAFKRTRYEDPLRATITTNTLLSIHRLNINVWKKLEIGGEYRILYQHETRTRRDGYLAEIGIRATQNLRVGLGYNFTDFSDNIASENNYSVQGVFFRIQGVL